VRYHQSNTQPPGEADTEARLRRELGDRLARLREARGLTQGQLAAELGTSQHVISHYERGVHAPRLLTLLRLRRLFGVSLDHLLVGTAPGELADPRLRKLALAADALPYDLRTLVVTALQGLVDLAQVEARRLAPPGAER
jgi:transcriptional regulator with XRE-family HTH domain